VVNISVASRVAAAENPLLRDPFFRRFLDLPDRPPPEREALAAGSGVIVDARRGLVVTNNHVARGADRITVTLKDRRELRAELVGADPATDIALLRVEARGLAELPFGDSDEPRGGRRRAGDRQPVRARPDRHLGHRQRWSASATYTKKNKNSLTIPWQGCSLGSFPRQ
jgi:S1-C subfamily serine protease